MGTGSGRAKLAQIRQDDNKDIHVSFRGGFENVVKVGTSEHNQIMYLLDGLRADAVPSPQRVAFTARVLEAERAQIEQEVQDAAEALNAATQRMREAGIRAAKLKAS